MIKRPQKRMVTSTTVVLLELVERLHRISYGYNLRLSLSSENLLHFFRNLCKSPKTPDENTRLIVHLNEIALLRASHRSGVTTVLVIVCPAFCPSGGRGSMASLVSRTSPGTIGVGAAPGVANEAGKPSKHESHITFVENLRQ